MASQYPRRRIDDWIPDLGDLGEWLAEQAKLGWEPEYGGTGVASASPARQWLP